MPDPEESPLPTPDEGQPTEIQEVPEPAAEDDSDWMELGSNGLPLCSVHKIDASSFCLIENCPFALNCVLCLKDHEQLRRLPEMNHSLALILNRNLADQLFNPKDFQELEFRQRIKDMILKVKLNFNRQCDSLESLFVERMETESHEFMLKKIRRFLDKARDEYNERKQSFSLLKELCSTFNDFLLLKKSDQVPTVRDELRLYESLMGQFNKTVDLSFKYLTNKICRTESEVTAAKESTQASKQSFSEEMKTTVKQPRSEAIPRHVTVQSVKCPPPEEHAKTVQTTPSVYMRETPTNGSRPQEQPGRTKLYKKKQFQIQSVEETSIEVRGVSPGPRKIKKTRVSYTTAEPPVPPRRKSVVKTIQSEHQPDREFTDFDFEQETVKSSRIDKGHRKKFSQMNFSGSRGRSRTPVRHSEHVVKNNEEYSELLRARQGPQDFDSLNFSNILKLENDMHFLRNHLFGKKVVFHRLYQASKDGFDVSTFHKKCDNRGPTLCLVRSKSNQRVFGGFAEQAWTPDLNDSSTENSIFKRSFLFTLKDRNILHLTGRNDSRALCYSEKRGPLFGKFNVLSGDRTYYTYDLCINLMVDGSKPNYSCSQVGTTFGPVHRPIQGFCSSFLAGDNYFEIDELEVFQVQF